jgi:hypothetical protein
MSAITSCAGSFPLDAQPHDMGLMMAWEFKSGAPPLCAGTLLDCWEAGKAR